jgi:hypothetical protein
MSATTDTLRIFKNIELLLTGGVFAGQVSSALVEAQQFVATVVADLESKSEQEARNSVGSETSSGGVGSGGVQNRKRKNSKRKANPA